MFRAELPDTRKDSSSSDSICWRKGPAAASSPGLQLSFQGPLLGHLYQFPGAAGSRAQPGQQEFIFSVLEAASPRSRCRQGWSLRRPLPGAQMAVLSLGSLAVSLSVPASRPLRPPARLDQAPSTLRTSRSPLESAHPPFSHMRRCWRSGPQRVNLGRHRTTPTRPVGITHPGRVFVFVLSRDLSAQPPAALLRIPVVHALLIEAFSSDLCFSRFITRLLSPPHGNACVCGGRTKGQACPLTSPI